MYENEIYSDPNNRNQASGVFSGAQSGMGQTENGTDNRANNYSTYQTGNDNAFSNSATQNLYGYDGGKQNKEKKTKSDKGSGFFRKALLSISMGLFFGLFAGLGFYAVQQVLVEKEPVSNESVITESEPLSEVSRNEGDIKLTNTGNITVVESDVSDMVEEVMPAMVSIINNYTETGRFWGQTYTQEQEASGSGIIVQQNDTELLIVSNYHVIADATSLEVTFIDGTTAEAKVKGTDADMDLAVIAIPLDAISAETKDAISIAALGDSDKLRMGEPVVAIGNALGYGQSVTNGIVSALNRELTLSDGSTGTFIQTNAEINPGNSGGALLNIKGEVVGINSNKIGGDTIEGMGYAIPISSASPIIADLMERHTRDKVEEDEKGYIGITLQNVTSQYAEMLNMPIGVYVYSVDEGSAAEAAGMLPGDIITEFDGEKISSNVDLQEMLQYYAAGDRAKIVVMRLEKGQYVEHELDITLGERPESAENEDQTEEEESSRDSYEDPYEEIDPFGGFFDPFDSFGGFGMP